MYKFLLAATTVVGLALGACTDPTVIGGELVDGTQLPLNYTDSLPITLTTRAADSSRVNFATITTVGFAPVGCLLSPNTGTTSARLGIELVERGTRRLETLGNVIDSAVLVLPLASARQIGDTLASVSLRVLGATGRTIGQAETRSATPLLDNATVYGELSTVLPRKRGVVPTYTIDSTRRDSVAPQLRIRLNQAFLDVIQTAMMRRSPTDSLPNDTLFVSSFPGIIVEGTDCGRTIPAVSFAGSDAAQLGVSIYYTRDGKTRQFWLSPRRVSNNAFLGGYGEARLEYRNDYGSTLTSRLLAGNTSTRDSVAVVQSLDGTLIRVGFPDLTSFSRRNGVTYAELEIPVLPGTTDLIRPVANLIVKLANNSGDLLNYTAIPGAQAGAAYDVREGGRLVYIDDPLNPADSIQAYRFNITTLFQSFVSGERTPELFIVANGQSILPGESILAGPKGSPYRARLKVASAVLP